MNNHYKKFVYKGMKLLRITQTPNAGDYQKPVQLSGQSQLKIKRNPDMIPFFMKTFSFTSNVGTFWQYLAVMMKGFGIRANDLQVIRIVLMQL